MLVSDKPGQAMTPGEGKDAWALESVSASKDDRGNPQIRIRLDDAAANCFGPDQGEHRKPVGDDRGRQGRLRSDHPLHGLA